MSEGDEDVDVMVAEDSLFTGLSVVVLIGIAALVTWLFLRNR